MKDFKHAVATSFDDAAALLAKGNAAVIAGGTDLVFSLKGMHTPNLPDTVIDLKKIENAAYIKEEGGFLKIGALTTLTAIAEDSTVNSKYAVLAQAAKAVASPELRNVGTIGGNICQKPRCIYYRQDNNTWDCARKGNTSTCFALAGVARYHSIFGAMGGCIAVCPSDTAPALVALKANIVTTKKTWAAADFFGLSQKKFNGENINWLDADEVVKEIQIPAGTYKSCYKKWAFRKAIDFPQVSAAIIVKDGKADIALGGVYNTPKYFEGVSTSSASEDCLKDAKPITSSYKCNNSSEYKVQIAKTMIKRAIAEL